MEARIIEGPKPSILDAEVECEKRGYGKLKTDGFIAGVLKACHKAPVVDDTSKRRAAWVASGFEWATKDMERRAAKGIV